MFYWPIKWFWSLVLKYAVLMELVAWIGKKKPVWLYAMLCCWLVCVECAGWIGFIIVLNDCIGFVPIYPFCDWYVGVNVVNGFRIVRRLEPIVLKSHSNGFCTVVDVPVVCTLFWLKYDVEASQFGFCMRMVLVCVASTGLYCGGYIGIPIFSLMLNWTAPIEILYVFFKRTIMSNRHKWYTQFTRRKKREKIETKHLLWMRRGVFMPTLKS